MFIGRWYRCNDDYPREREDGGSVCKSIRLISKSIQFWRRIRQEVLVCGVSTRVRIGSWSQVETIEGLADGCGRGIEVEAVSMFG